MLKRVPRRVPRRGEVRVDGDGGGFLLLVDARLVDGSRSFRGLGQREASGSGRGRHRREGREGREGEVRKRGVSRAVAATLVSGVAERARGEGATGVVSRASASAPASALASRRLWRASRRAGAGGAASCAETRGAVTETARRAVTSARRGAMVPHRGGFRRAPPVVLPPPRLFWVAFFSNPFDESRLVHTRLSS